MLTRELQKIAECAGSTLFAGAQMSGRGLRHSNWADFTVAPAPGSDQNLVRAVAAEEPHAGAGPIAADE